MKPKYDILGPCPCTGPQHFCDENIRAAYRAKLVVEFLSRFLDEGAHQVSFHAQVMDDPDDETTLGDLIRGKFGGPE